MRKKSNHIQLPLSDKIFRAVALVILAFIMAIIIYPIWFVLVASFTNPLEIYQNAFLFWPKEFNFESYKLVFKDQDFITGFVNSIFYTVVGTTLNVVMNICGAYPLSKRNFKGKSFFTIMFTFTMFFSGGMVPLYLTIQDLGLYNTLWALVLPMAVSVYNLIVCRSFFESSLPIELLEAAKLDGCSDFGFFFKIAIPLSSTIIAVMVLFYATAMWNVYFNAIMYLRDESKMPLQVILRNLVLANQVNIGSSGAELADRTALANQLKYVVVTLAAFPLIIVYPFVQKYFAKGVMIGAVKG